MKYILIIALSFITGFCSGEELKDNICYENKSTEDGWLVTNPYVRKEDVAYVIILNNDKKNHQFYLCKIEGNSRKLIRELEISIDFEKNHIAANTCSISNGKFGNEYFAVVDNNSLKVLHPYYFNFKKENIEIIKNHKMTCYESGEQ